MNQNYFCLATVVFFDLFFNHSFLTSIALFYFYTHSSEAKGNNTNKIRMLESTLSSMSMSPSVMCRGVNRPPELSSSSISSFEELNSKGNYNYFNYVTQHGGTPPSPLSNASIRSQFYSTPGSNFNSPTVGSTSTNIRQEGVNSMTYQNANTNTFVSTSRKYPNFDSSLYSRTVKSLPTFKEHVEESDQQRLPYRESIFSSVEDDGFHSFLQDSSKPTNSRYNSSDITDDSASAFKGWSTSNANSSHSLNNMGSVDENEQYFGNRLRTVSGTSSLGYHKVSNGSFSNIPEYPEELHVGTFRQGSESFDGISVSSDSPLPARVRYYSNDGPRQSHRQRVLSADALNMTSFCKSGVITSNHFHSRTYINDVISQDNRPRSFSSGHTSALSLPSGFGYSQPATVHEATDSNAIPNHQSRSFLRSSIDGMMQYSQHQNRHQESINPSGRSYMHEQHYQVQERGYINEDRVFPVHQQQSFGGLGHNLQLQLQIAPRMVYTVKFKRSQKNFVLGNHMNGDIKIGSYVKVEADRGEDLGIVLSRIPIEKFSSSARNASQNIDIPDVQFKKITRLATDEEISLLSLKEEEEAELLKICRSKTSQRGLPMNVVDAEYQFDRHKLTFFFEANCRVDFRELVRDLFSIYKTRIWMQQIDKVPNSPLGLTSIPNKVSRSGFEAKSPNYGNTVQSFGLDPTVAITGYEYIGGKGDEGF